MIRLVLVRSVLNVTVRVQKVLGGSVESTGLFHVLSIPFSSRSFTDLIWKSQTSTHRNTLLEDLGVSYLCGECMRHPQHRVNPYVARNRIHECRN